MDVDQNCILLGRFLLLFFQPQTQTQTKGSGVVYIGHIPHGFYERQMKNYFAQFGQVKRLRISRSKKVNLSSIIYVNGLYLVISIFHLLSYDHNDDYGNCSLCNYAINFLFNIILLQTGGIKGYAFVQFVDDFVAKVVADSMNNYLMFHKLLKCE